MKIVLENLTKKFPSRNKKDASEVVAVSDFTFEFPDGKLIGLLGPSGCGKSTTLHLISGLQTPTSGKIYFGEDSPKQRRKRRSILRRILALLHQMALETELFSRKAVSSVGNIFHRLTQALRRAIEKRAAAQERKPISSLPVAIGALCGCSAVAIFALGVMTMTLLAPYAVRYETVTVPDLEGKALSELSGSLEKINLTVVYESNPDVADGRVISQSVPAGATRRVSSQSGYFDLRVTVCNREPVTVPSDIVGESLRDGELKLKNNSLSYTVSEEYSSTVPKGKIISIYPKEGETVDSKTEVKLTVSLGKKETSLIVPDLSGLDESEAIRRIQLSGFTVGSIVYTPSEKPLGTVISQGLRPHSYAPKGSVISLRVAST